MRRHPDRQRIQPRPGQQINPAFRAARQHQSQRAGPKRCRQGARAVIGDYLGKCAFGVREMADQRVEMRAALGFKHGSHGSAIPRIRTKPIDRFGREGDEFTRTQQARRFRHLIRPKAACHPGRPSQTKPGFSKPGLP